MMFRYQYIDLGERIVFGATPREDFIDLGPLPFTTKQCFEKIQYRALAQQRKVLKITRVRMMPYRDK